MNLKKKKFNKELSDITMKMKDLNIAKDRAEKKD